MTYDEGTVDTLANALPIHEEYGIPGHLDVVAGQLGRPRNAFASSLNGYWHMSVDELRFLMDKGWGVGNHSWSHYVYPCHPGLDLYREIVWSKYRLEDMLDFPVRIFTIPNDVYNYEIVLPMIKEHYLACAFIEGGPNRDDFDLYKIGNCLVASGGFRPRPGWPEELKTENITLEFVQNSWVYETSHLCLWNVPQAHKCVTPEYMDARFKKLHAISDGKMWAATPDDVIDYELMKRNIQIENVSSAEGKVSFDVTGEWPVGVMNCAVTLKISDTGFTKVPRVEQDFQKAEGGYAAHKGIESIKKVGNDFLLTLQLAPHRTIHLSE
jgi:hypothetical protein